MAGLLRAARFMWVVPPLPPLMLPAFGLTTLAAAVVIGLDAARAADALTPVLLLQVFCCATGLLVPARRGHVDLLLTGGVSRRTAALVHGVCSAGPGVVSWLTLALVEAVVARTSRGALAAPGTAAALALTTVVPWLISVRLPRFAAAIGWLVVLTFAAAFEPVRGVILESPAAGGLQAVAVLYPPLLVGRSLSGQEGALVVAALLVAAASVAGVLIWIERQDVALEAAP